MSRYEFQITIAGEGDTPEEAWGNAVEAFQCDPGAAPEEFTVIEEDEEGNAVVETSDGTYSG